MLKNILDKFSAKQNPKVKMEIEINDPEKPINGDLLIELFAKKAPISVKNFLDYVKDGFYEDTIFHRVIDGFMIQGGGFEQDKTKKESASIATFEGVISHLEGVISMASTGAKVPGENQFFICDVDRTDLDGNYAAFGKTIYGMNIVKSIADVKTETKYLSTGQPMDDWPVEDVIINSITMAKE